MTAYESHLANAEERREYVRPEPFVNIDVETVLSDDHRPVHNGCACEERPDGGSWIDDQATWAAHVTAVLEGRNLLRDDRPAAKWKALAEQLCAEVARLKGMSIEQVRAAHGMSS